MSTKFLRKTARLAEAVRRRLRTCPARAGQLSARALRKAAGAFSSRRFVVWCLSLVIVAELSVLGIGVVRKLELAAERTEQASRVYMAAVEAQALGEQLRARDDGAADIGATAAAATEQPESTAGDGAPPLRPRDVETIVFDATGELPDLAPATDSAAATSVAPAVSEPLDAQGNKLSEEDTEELDSLIRKAVEAMVAGDMRLSVLCLEQANAISPEYPAMLYYYGMAYDKLLNPEKARDYYTRVFRQRDRAGKYFERASRRLTYGMEQPSAMRGKLSFGPPLLSHTYDDYGGDSVTLRLPILLAPGEEVRVEDILIRLRFFVLVNNRKIEFSSVKPQMQWENATQSFENCEENLIVTYKLPLLTDEEQGAYGSRRYYGYTAKLYYRGEPLDCMSSPSALVLHEQMLDARAAQAQLHSAVSSGLLPDDGLAPDDGLVPEFSDDELPLPTEEDVPGAEAAPAGEDEDTPFSRYIEQIDPSE